MAKSFSNESQFGEWVRPEKTSRQLNDQAINRHATDGRDGRLWRKIERIEKRVRLNLK